MKPTDTSLKSGGKLDDYPLLLAEVKEHSLRSVMWVGAVREPPLQVDLYRDIGRMILERQDIEGWGKAVVEQLTADLRTEFPGVSAFSASNLWRMKAFFEAYAGLEKLAPLVREIGLRVEERIEQEESVWLKTST